MPSIETRSYYLDGPFPPHANTLDATDAHIAAIVREAARHPGITLTFHKAYEASTRNPTLAPATGYAGPDRFIYIAHLADSADYCHVTAIDTAGTTLTPY